MCVCMCVCGGVGWCGVVWCGVVLCCVVCVWLGLYSDVVQAIDTLLARLVPEDSSRALTFAYAVSIAKTGSSRTYATAVYFMRL